MKTTASQIRIFIYPTDFLKTRQFYETHMKWPVYHQWDYGESKGVMFDTGSGIIELLWPIDEGEAPKHGRVSLLVSDVWSLWKELSDSVTVVFPLRQNPWGDDSFCIADPDGFRLTFFTNRNNASSQ